MWKLYKHSHLYCKTILQKALHICKVGLKEKKTQIRKSQKQFIMITSKNILGILGAAVAGVAIGVLFAPDKGKNTRKKIAKKSKNYGNDLYDKFGNIINTASKKGEELFAEGKNKFNAAKSEIKREY